MRYWAVEISADRYEAERLYRHERLAVTVPDGAGMSLGDRVALVGATRPPVVFALGTIASIGALGDRARAGAQSVDPTAVEVAIAYDRRLFDAPLLTVPAPADQRVAEIDPSQWAALSRAAPMPDGTQTWLVSLDMPIEASSAAEAVRQFWTYVAELGPSELPTFVSPSGDELAMQALVAGVEVNLDPEEDE